MARAAFLDTVGAVTFDPRLYRLLHTGTPGDLAFYRARCAGADRVLELGCGDGRLLLPIAADGARVTGIERHPGMLSAARDARAALPAAVAERVELIEGDMAAFDLPHRFDRVIVPYTALYCLAPDDRQRCLRRIAGHLTPAGALIFDVWPGDELWERGPFADEDPEWIDALRDGDTAIEVFERDVHVPGRIDVIYIHQIARPGQMPTRTRYTVTHHYLRVDDVEPTLAAAGLRPIEMFGDFDGGPVDEESERLVVVAEAIR